MNFLLKILTNKYLLAALIPTILGVVGSLWAKEYGANQVEEKWQTYKRQVEGKLSEKEERLQGAHHNIGVMKSKLTTQKDLVDEWKNAKEERDEEFQKFVKEHNLKISSMDHTIASLKQKLKGGHTEVTIETSDKKCKNIGEQCVIKYQWKDTFNRFLLIDTNIFVKGDEKFESNQVFKIYGEIYEQKDGSLKTKRLVLREVVKTDDGRFMPIPNGKADLISSDFIYVNPPESDDKSWTDAFTLRPLVLASVSMLPDTGRLKLGLGVELLKLESVGLNTHTAFSFKNIDNAEQRLGLLYNPKVLSQDLNFSIGTSVGTPFTDFGDKWSFNVDLLFYAW